VSEAFTPEAVLSMPSVLKKSASYPAAGVYRRRFVLDVSALNPEAVLPLPVS